MLIGRIDRVFVDRVFVDRVYVDRVFVDRVYVDRVCVPTTASPNPVSVRLRSTAGQQHTPLTTHIFTPQHVVKRRMRRASTMAAYSSTLMLGAGEAEVPAPVE